MNTKIVHSLYALFVAGALLASGCSNDDDTSDFYATHPDAVRFHITAGDAPQTRVNTEDDGTTFDPDDQIAISADGGTSYSTYQLGDDWLPTEGQRYLRWKEQILSFQAYYPVTPGTDYTTFTLPMDQSNETKLRNADYMTAEATDQSFANPVALTFKHQLAKVTITSITLGEEVKDNSITQVTFHTKGHILVNGSITDDNVDVTYTPCSTNDKFMVVLPPQSENNSAAFIKVLLDNGKECTLTGIPELAPGKAYTLSLQVGHDGVKLAAPITVAEWGSGVDMTGGTAMVRPEYYLWYTANPDASEFTLSTADELRAFAKLVNSDQEALTFTTATGPVSFEGKTVQIADAVTTLDLSGTQWTPIGKETAPFAGIFDGKGKEIKGLTITASSGDNIGLFGYIDSDAALVKNVRLTGVDIACENSSNIGGVVGKLDRGSVSSCYVSGTIAGYSAIGGIAGKALGSSNRFITDCYTAGSITGGFRYPCLIGGIVGYALVPVENCYSTANVTTADSTAGGIVGSNTGTIISHCYSIGTVSGDAEIGGITGTCGDRSKTTGCIALNVEVKANKTNNNTRFGRISGGISESAIIEDCHAFEGMNVYKGSELQAINDGAVDNINGADLDATACLTAATYTGAGWSTDHWAFDSNTPMQSLPWLKVFDTWTWENVADYRLAVPTHLVQVP